MNLNTVTAIRHPASAGEIENWHAGNAWLAGRTWLFSEHPPNVLPPAAEPRSIPRPAASLSTPAAFRHTSLTKLCRSAALILGPQTTACDDLLITITAATPRPVQLRFARPPSAEELRQAI